MRYFFGGRQTVDDQRGLGGIGRGWRSGQGFQDTEFELGWSSKLTGVSGLPAGRGLRGCGLGGPRGRILAALAATRRAHRAVRAPARVVVNVAGVVVVHPRDLMMMMMMKTAEGSRGERARARREQRVPGRIRMRST